MGKKKKKGRSISNCTTWKSAAPTQRKGEEERAQPLGEKGERRRKGRGRMEAWVELYISDLGDGLLHFFILFAFSFACMHICRERMLHYILDP